MANQHFWPEIEPFATGELRVDEPHVLYWEQVGRANGEPVLFLHGGPGVGSSDTDRRFFDPNHFRVVLFDQRGCGRSSPTGELQNNTIDHLVADIEALRLELGIDSWHVFGGSWGSTLALYYAQAVPEAVRSLVLRGIWLLRAEELEWWLYTLRFVQPELWERFSGHVPEDQRHDLLSAYGTLLDSPDPDVSRAAARLWCDYEMQSCTLVSNPEFTALSDDDEAAWAVARLEAHYFANCRFEPDDRLLQHVDTIRSIPAVIIHGRYDMVCPVKNAHDLRRVWPEATTVIVPDAGHSSHEPGITEQLVAAMNRIKDTGDPRICA